MTLWHRWMSRMGRVAHSLKSFSLPSANTQDATTLLKLADLDEAQHGTP